MRIHASRVLVTSLAFLALIASARAAAFSTSSFADLPGGVFVNFTSEPVGSPFGPFQFNFGAGHVVTATHDPDSIDCGVGSFAEPLTHPNNPSIDPGDASGRGVKESGECSNLDLILDFSEPVTAVGATFKHYACGLLAQGNRLIQAFDGPGGTGTLVGSASTDSSAFPCFAIWLDFVGVVSDQANIRSLVIVADTQTTMVSGIAASPGAPAPSCAGDVNGDGDTNAADFTILAGNFGASVAPNTGGDLNGDGLVNAADFTILAGSFGCEG